MKPKIFDISPKISPRLAVFPGDQAFVRQVNLSFSAGDALELSSISGSLHLGAHADAPSHYRAGGASIEQRDLLLYLGPAQVMRAREAKPGERLRPEHLPHPPRAPRVLVHTGSFPDPENWRGDFNSFSPELLELWAGQGVRLVGIDTPSVDPCESKALESHQVLYARDMAVLEGLVLAGVPEGLYTLIALPLAIEGADASPVRAVLIEGEVG